MRVPLLDVCRENTPIQDELRAAFAHVLESGQFILGPEVERFEEMAAVLAGARFAVGMSSGTDALITALLALGIGPGDEVICPAFTFFATGGCIARVGARPVFADCCANSFNLDPAAIEPLMTERTKAIIPVHLFGQMADMDPILETARRYGLKVIEDAAQAFGALYHGRPAGSFGDFGAFSFYPSKNLGGLGDAGLLVTNDAELAKEARLLRNHGAGEQYVHRIVGGNFRLDAVQAALLAVKLPHWKEYTAKRQQHACEYQRLLGGFPTIHLPAMAGDRTHIINQYTIRVGGGKRDALRAFLQAHGIASAIYYPIPLHQQECFRPFGPHRPLAVTEALCADVLSLPVFPQLTGEEQEAVAQAIAEFLEC